MREMIVVATVGILTGCVMGLPPWHGFLDTERPPWQQYLDQRIDVAVTNQPLADFLHSPLFPDFNCIISLGGQAEPSKAEGDDPFPAESGVESERIVVTLTVKGITRREALWRIEKQCNLEMTIARDESGSPRCVLIKQRKRNAEPPPGN